MPLDRMKHRWTLEVGTPKRHEAESKFVECVAEVYRDGPGTNIRRDVLLMSLQRGVVACSVRVVNEDDEVVIEGFFIRIAVRLKFEVKLLVTPGNITLPAPAVEAIHFHCRNHISDFLRESSSRSLRELARLNRQPAIG